MATRLYREYKFKFYLNANHYIIINGKNGQTHPHTWEFVFYIMKSEGEFVLFNKFEKAIEEYLEKFQGRVMNEIPPFDTMVPTLENISDYFCDEIRSIITKLGGELAFMESTMAANTSVSLLCEGRATPSSPNDRVTDEEPLQSDRKSVV